MAMTFVLAFREYLEAFLIIGVFFGLSLKLNLRREKEILLASAIGIFLSFLLPLLTFYLGDHARILLTEKRAELLEGYLMIFSGCFIAYIVFSLHRFFVQKRAFQVIKAHQKLTKNIFDFSLFASIVFFVAREGFEIALFTATTSLFSTFISNLIGLTLGFFTAAIIGVLTSLAFIAFPLGKIYKLTEYFILILGASLVKNGLSELTEVYMDIHISRIFPFPLHFLPQKSTIAGHLIATLFGLEKNFGLLDGSIMIGYIFLVYYFLIRRRRSAPIFN
ncbi:MAG TPA: FTR1 family protein [Patescibacteria group bacterium]|nr:FTR1 family protein [Patescibacteria group bacterium]